MTDRRLEEELASLVPAIQKEYGYALLAYLLPLLFLGLWIAFEESTKMVFFLGFILSIFPCAIAGLVLSIIGLKSSWKSADIKHRILGGIGLLIGVVWMCGGILGPMVLMAIIGR
jgi:hypothetical protein